MHNAVCSEIIKFRRNKMAWVGTLIIATIPLFMIWNRLVIDPQREYMEWLMSVLMLNTLILPIVNGFVITSNMQREYQDRTIRNVLTAPVSREKFLTAKLVVWFLWYLISICLSEVIVTAGIVLSCHACHIGKRSIAGGRTASIRRTNTASLYMPLDGSIHFRYGGLGNAVLENMHDYYNSLWDNRIYWSFSFF